LLEGSGEGEEDWLPLDYIIRNNYGKLQRGGFKDLSTN
jgi:hypothetical protein